jgi:hypothetical protein
MNGHLYHNDQRALQARFPTGEMADLLEPVIVRSEVLEAERAAGTRRRSMVGCARSGCGARGRR